MSDIKISLDSSGTDGSISVVRVDGVIDTMTATELEKVMNSLLERNKYKIIVDLGGVDYISSAGWGIFISNIREIRQHAGDIKLARMIPNVYEIFELLEFDSILRAFDSLEKAKNDFSGEVAVSAAVAEAVASKAESTFPKGETAVPEEMETTTVTSSPAASVDIKSKPAPKMQASMNIEALVLDMVAKDPFYTISEIKKEISRKHGGTKAGWWRIWGILRKNDLLSKKNRFRRARNKAGES